MSFRPITSRSAITTPNMILTNKPNEQQLITLPKINIMTYNVNFGGVSWDGVANLGGQRALQAIHEHSHELDIVCLQETHQGWEYALNHFKPTVSSSSITTTSVTTPSSLRSAFPHQYWDHTKTNHYLASGSAVLASRHFDLNVQMLESRVQGSFFDAMHIVVKDLRRRDFSSSTLQHEEIGISEMESNLEEHEDFMMEDDDSTATTSTAASSPILQILNLHLRPPLSFDSSNFLDNAAAYLWKTTSVRRDEVKSYVEQALQKHPNVPLILLGDFNEKSSVGVLSSKDSFAKYLNELEYIDALQDATTWYWPLKGSFSLWGSYDHVFYRKQEWKVEKQHILQEYKECASDHLPCIVTLRKVNH
ncbi:hypothetical protein C9374_010382 [Naegleria lovaniensis]|uniref:Endonuclease/exonuclease/phosphatase domain-containing protein n=1 Tax=Naegleria lovaniensis TaxID=51637 RepID=A0AA88GH04_NAELO|nr:uncharacterized protein C9374_010382 [Naegleria lovaniensis]KAG2375008.1 hypothetical protein C9374_010382 [Naegleria lovaniensis]